MIDVIRGITDYQSKTPQQIHDELAELVQYDDTTEWTVGMLVDRLKPTNTITILNAMKTVGATNPIMESARIALSTKDGLTLHQPARQVMIDLLGLSPELTAITKALGRPSRTRWASLGGTGSVPTVKQITSALTVDTLRHRVVQAYNATITAMDAGEVLTWEQAVAKFGEG